MAIHAALAAQKALSFAGPDVPLVLAGDWNVKPGDAVHSLLITGDIAKDSAAYPTPPGPWERFSPALPAPLRSACASSRHLTSSRIPFSFSFSLSLPDSTG